MTELDEDEEVKEVLVTPMMQSRLRDWVRIASMGYEIEFMMPDSRKPVEREVEIRDWARGRVAV